MRGEFDRLMRALRLNETEYCEILAQYSIERTMDKGEKLKEEDRKYVMFLTSGLLRGYVIDKKGEEVTDCFMRRYAEACTLDLSIVGCKQEMSIRAEALEETKLVCFEIYELMPLLSRSPELLSVVNHSMAQNYIDLWNHKMILYRTTAMERYEWFLQYYPGLIDVVPHKYIASFLGMTPVTLSRLRKTVYREQLWIP